MRYCKAQIKFLEDFYKLISTLDVDTQPVSFGSLPKPPYTSMPIYYVDTLYVTLTKYLDIPTPSEYWDIQDMRLHLNDVKLLNKILHEDMKWMYVFDKPNKYDGCPSTIKFNHSIYISRFKRKK